MLWLTMSPVLWFACAAEEENTKELETAVETTTETETETSTETEIETEPEYDPTVSILDQGPDIHAELVGPEAWAVADAGYGRLVFSGEQIWMRDVRKAETDLLEWIEGDVHAAVEYDGWIMLSIGDDLWVWDDELWASPLEGDLMSIPTAMQVDYWGDLWLMAGKLYRVIDGELESYTLDGEDITGHWAIDGLVDDWHLTWLAHGNSMVGIDLYGEIREQKDWTDIRQLVTDGEGNTWVNDGGNIRYRRSQSAWFTLEIPELCSHILGNSKGMDVWLSCIDPGEDGDYSTTEDNARVDYMGSAVDGIAPVVVPQGEWLRVDPSGRLLIQTEEGISRLSGSPWLRILDVPENLDSNALLVMLPSVEEGVESMTATVGLGTENNPWDLGAEQPWEIPLSPLDYTEADLNNGMLDIQVTVTWADGQSASATTSVQVVDSVATWEDNIQPMHASSCEVCHGSTAATVLDSKQDWIDNIDNIILQVSTNAMPLGGPYFTADEVDLVRSWKENGFQ